MPDETANFISELVDTNPDGSVDKVFILDNQLRTVKKALQGSFPNFTSNPANMTEAELNLLVGVLGPLAELAKAQQWTEQQNFQGATLVDGTNIAWDLKTEQVASVTLGGNRILDNPTNIVAGGTYVLYVLQDGTGSRLLTFGANYRWGDDGLPTLSTGVNKMDVLTFLADPSGTFLAGAYKLGF